MINSKLVLILSIFCGFNSFSQPVDLVKRAELNDPRAQFMLGRIYANGDGVSKNSVEALKWFNKSAAADNADAIAYIGIMHSEGEGFSKDYVKAIGYYKKAIELGGNRGMVAYARALVKGEGVSKNLELAHQLLKTAVNNNSPAAMYTLGTYYKNKTIKGFDGESLIAAAADRGYDDAIVSILLHDIFEQENPDVAKVAFDKLILFKNKNVFAAYGVSYYYLFINKPPAIEQAKKTIEPYEDKNKLLYSMIMTEISLKSEDYPNALRYMQSANDEVPNTFNLKEVRVEYSKFLEKEKKREYELSRQSEFIKLTSSAQEESRVAQNDMQRGGIKAARDSGICKIMSNRNVDYWVGYIDKLSANSDGLGVLSISIAQGVNLKTWNNSLSDMGSKTLILPESELFKKASQMKVGQKVAFSGSFLMGNSRECLREASLSLSGSLIDPEFIFKFNDITAVQ